MTADSRTDHEWLAGQFDAHRSQLRAVAFRMLGSLSEADDAVQDAWLRLRRVDAASIKNLGAWLSTVVGRVCLNRLRSRRSRPVEALDVHVPDPILSRDDFVDPEHTALLGDSVGLALLVVLATGPPAGCHRVLAVDEGTAVVLAGDRQGPPFLSSPSTWPAARRSALSIQARPTPISWDVGATLAPGSRTQPLWSLSQQVVG